MNKKEQFLAIDDTINVIIARSSKCENCELCHDNRWCFFGYQCVINDFCNYTKKKGRDK